MSSLLPFICRIILHSSKRFKIKVIYRNFFYPAPKSIGKLTFLKFIGKGLDKVKKYAILILNKLRKGLTKLIILPEEVKDYAQ